MASILTPEDVVRRIAAECTFIDERVDDSGKGLLEEVGLGKGGAAGEPKELWFFPEAATAFSRSTSKARKWPTG